MSKFSAHEKSREADWEFRMRIQVYQRRGWYGPKYTRKLELMKEIADDYALLSKLEKDPGKEPDLFNADPDSIDRL